MCIACHFEIFKFGSFGVYRACLILKIVSLLSETTKRENLFDSYQDPYYQGCYRDCLDVWWSQSQKTHRHTFPMIYLVNMLVNMKTFQCETSNRELRSGFKFGKTVHCRRLIFILHWGTIKLEMRTDSSSTSCTRLETVRNLALQYKTKTADRYLNLNKIFGFDNNVMFYCHR